MGQEHAVAAGWLGETVNLRLERHDLLARVTQGGDEPAVMRLGSREL